MNYHELSLIIYEKFMFNSWKFVVARLCRLLPKGRKNSC